MGVGSGVRSFFVVIWRILDGLRKSLHLALLLLIFGALLAALHTSLPVIPRSAALVIAPEGELVEQLATDPLQRAVGEATGGPAPETLLKDVLDAIAAAKSDSRIKLIVLDLEQLSPSGLSKLQEIGDAIRDFRAGGKRVVVAANTLDQTRYYLAAQAGEVYLDPLGIVYIDGFSYYRMFLKDAVDKLGIDVNVFRAGTFKTYTDQYSRSDMAPSDKEEATAWLNALWGAYQRDVTRARSLPPAALDEFIAQAPAALHALAGDEAKLALQRGLVTALKSRRQVADELKSLVGEDTDEHSFNSVAMMPYLASIRSRHVLQGKPDARIGVVVAAGEILDGRQPPGTIGGESASELLRDARYDNTIKAVVLRVDSPGGSMFASEQILREVQALRKAGKPVVVSMSSYGASGGYYIAAAANEIFASPTTLTGSIGVFTVIPTFEHTLDKLGVKVDGIGTSPLAGALRLDRALSPESKQMLQSSVDHAYAEFLQRVGDGRRKSVDDIEKIAEGRVWAGVDAQRLGLIDHLGGLRDAVAAAEKLADLGADTPVDYLESEISLREQLLLQLRSQAIIIARAAGLVPRSAPLLRLMDPVVAEARVLARFNDPHGLYAYCWCAQIAVQSRMTLPDFPEFMISNPSR
jgi:protease IV